MKVQTKEAAWQYVNEAFPTDYHENLIKSKNAGYPIYDSNLGDEHGFICDLGDRLEINFPDGHTCNVWIETPDTFRDLDTESKDHITRLFSVWLRQYTHSVIFKVMALREDIITNPFAMKLLEELAEREEKEYNDFSHSIGCMLRDFETFGNYDPHNHPTTHAGSYRDILYDMYIKD